MFLQNSIKQKSRGECIPLLNNTHEKTLNLKTLDDDELLLQTKFLVQKERQMSVLLISHLQEIWVRKLYLEKGFSSLFQYAVQELGYSESSAYRRIKAMKLCSALPSAKSQIESGKLNLNAAGMLQNFFEQQEKKADQMQKNINSVSLKQKTSSLLLDSGQKSLGQKDLIQQISLLDSNNVKSVENTQEDEMTQNESSPHTENTQEDERTSQTENTQEDENTSNTDSRPAVSLQESNSEASSLKMNVEQKLNLIQKAEGKSIKQTEKLLSQMSSHFSNKREKVKFIDQGRVEMKIILEEEDYKKLEKLKSLLSHKNPKLKYGKLLQLLIDAGLDRYDLERKKAYKKRNAGAVKSKNIFDKDQKTDEDTLKIEKIATQNREGSQMKNLEYRKSYNVPKKLMEKSRYIPVHIKQYVMKRDQRRCTYVCQKTKRRCSSQYFLQIDHIQPFALGGLHSPDNLRLLCGNHNKRQSEKVFGKKK